MPFFEDKVGDGRAFSAVRDVGEVASIAKVEGRADFTYSIRREFGDLRLAWPPVLWISMVEEARETSTRHVIARVGPFRYRECKKEQP